MAPTKGKPSGGAAKKSGGKSSRPSSSSGPRSKTSKPSKKPAAGGVVKSTQQKTKPLSHRPEKKKKRVYTEKELNIPALNSITPAGIGKPRGMKKGKTFVDDGEGMLAILAVVQAEKEGNIESKIQRARQLEEIREAKRAEQEKRVGEKRKRFDEVKDEVKGEVKKKKGDKRRARAGEAELVRQLAEEDAKPKKTKKSVRFG